MQKMLGLCDTENVTKIDELLQAGTDGYPRFCQNVEEKSVLEDGRIGRSKDKKEENHKKGIQKIVE